MTTDFATASAGPWTAIGHVDSQGTVHNAVAVFRTQGVDPRTSVIEVQVPRVVEADGQDRTTAVVTLKDTDGTLAGPAGTGASVVVVPSVGSATPAADNGDGTYTAVLTSTQAGTSTVGFEVGGVRSPSEDTVSFVPTPTPPTRLTASGTTVTGLAQPGNAVRVYHGDGSEVCRATAGPDGRFTCGPISPPAHSGDTLYATASVREGGREFTSDKTSAVVVAGTPTPGPPEEPSPTPSGPPSPTPPGGGSTPPPAGTLPPEPPRPAPTPPGPKTGAENIVPAAGGAVGALFAGLVMLAISRRRRITERDEQSAHRKL
jgi:LPXTG-motif cell wall-anchored protein